MRTSFIVLLGLSVAGCGLDSFFDRAKGPGSNAFGFAGYFGEAPDRDACPEQGCGEMIDQLLAGDTWTTATDDAAECDGCQKLASFRWTMNDAGELRSTTHMYVHDFENNRMESDYGGCEQTMQAFVENVDGYEGGERVVITWYMERDTCTYATGMMFDCAVHVLEADAQQVPEEYTLWDTDEAAAETPDAELAQLEADGISKSFMHCRSDELIDGTDYCVQ